MGHLITVQNLLILLGGQGAIHMQRDVLRGSSPERPIPFTLERVELAVLARYVAAERPLTVPPHLEQRVAALVAMADQTAGMATHRVGAIYEVLRWLFAGAGVIPPGGVDVGSLLGGRRVDQLVPGDLLPQDQVERFEARQQEWGVHEEDFILRTPYTLEAARDALEAIAVQGEGFGDAGTSHFSEFLTLVDAFEANQIQAEPLVRSPSTGSPIGGESQTLITAEYSRLWATVFNLQYGGLVLSIHHALVTDRNVAEPFRSKLAREAIRTMRKVIDATSNLLTELPATLPADPGRAGPPYELPPALLDTTDDAVLRERQIDNCDALEGTYVEIEAHADFGMDPLHAVTIANLRTNDARRRALM